MTDLALLLFTSALAAGKPKDNIEMSEEDKLLKEIEERRLLKENEVPKDRYEEIGFYVCLFVLVILSF